MTIVNTHKTINTERERGRERPTAPIHLIKSVRSISHSAEVEDLEHHLVLGECAGLVGEEVGDAAQLLRDGGGPDHCALHILVPVDDPGVEGLPYVQVHSQAGRRFGLV